jgi:adenylate cyclase
MDLAEAHGFRIWTAAGSCLAGAAQVELGRPEEGLTAIRRGLDRYAELRSPPVFWPLLLFLDARAKHVAGRPADGLQAVDAALGYLEPVGSLVPELHLLKGDLLAGRPIADGGGSAAARHWYERAYDRAEELGARMTCLRAAFRLVRAGPPGDDAGPDVARLRTVLASFTEGFDTADLQDVRGLLAEVDARA